MSALQPGTVIAGDFRILRPLSAGGMGAVYVALQLSTQRERALKVMLGDLAQNEDLKSRFVQEAQIGSQIASDHAVEMVAAGIDPATGAPWLAMELLEGEDLAGFLARSGPLEPALVLELFDQMCHALSAAHQKGIVHRDLKLENVFLARSRRSTGTFMVKVLDFGIAKLLGAAKSSATAAIGTPLWMAPEQTEASHAITPAADVWAMGLIAFRALSGRLFWKTAADPNASSMMVLREVVFEPLAVASERSRELGGAPMPPGFDAWFARCTDRDPHRRFPDAGAMHAALRGILLAAPKPSTLASPFQVGPTAYGHTGPATSHPVPVVSAGGMVSSGSAYGPAAAYGPAPTPAPAPSFVTVPPVVPAMTGGTPVRFPPPPGMRRKKSPLGLIIGLGVAGTALTIGAVVLVTSAADDDDGPPAPAPPRPAAPATATGPTRAVPEPPRAPATPFATMQAWQGWYVCAQGKTELELRIESVNGLVVNGIFQFQQPASGVYGSFHVSGPYDPNTRRLRLTPGAWIRQPPGYTTVGMEGVVSADGSTYSGSIAHTSCTTFAVILAAGGGASP
jgi:serine/threonine protein kinase